MHKIHLHLATISQTCFMGEHFAVYTLSRDVTWTQIYAHEIVFLLYVNLMWAQMSITMSIFVCMNFHHRSNDQKFGRLMSSETSNCHCWSTCKSIHIELHSVQWQVWMLYLWAWRKAGIVYSANLNLYILDFILGKDRKWIYKSISTYTRYKIENLCRQ